MKRAVLKSTDRPIAVKELWAFDTEDDGNGTLKQISFTDGERYYDFTTREAAWAWLLAFFKRDVVIVATNLEYDLLNLFGRRLDLLELRLKASGSVIVSARLLGTKIRFYDTLNHSPFGVARIGELVGLPKLKMNLRSWEYVHRDTLITWTFAKRMQDSYNALGANFCATLPGTALDLYRRRFLPFPIQQPRSMAFVFQAYYGGRTEVFSLAPTEGPVWYVDVNSMYPAVMRADFPNPNVERSTRNIEGFGVAEATVKIPRSTYFPVLPYRDKRLLFPVGTIRGAWTFHEIREAVERGATIQTLHKAVRYPVSCQPFLGYVDALYPIKQRATNEVDKYAAKILLNSLYGKMGERLDVVTIVPASKVPADKAALLYGEFAYVRHGTRIPNHSNGLLAVYVTAYARLVLQRELERIAKLGGTVLYCDTDSIIYRSPKSLHKDSRELGAWRLEDTFDFACFRAPKLYSLWKGEDRTVHAKGVPRSVAVQFFDEGKATYSRPFRLRSILKAGKDGTAWGKFTKEIRTPYTKRKVLPLGETRPIIYQGPNPTKGR